MASRSAVRCNFDYHTRTDNGGGINNAFVYQSTSSGISFTNSPYIPTTVPTNQYSAYEALYSEALGFVSQPQVAYTRVGANLAIQPVGSSAFDKSIIPTYNEYVSDTWHVKPTFTVVYGLGYTIEMPPYEINGKQVTVVDQSGEPIIASNYFAQKQAQALQGQSYDPLEGFAGVRTIGTGLKYPYNPVYNEFSPRVAVAWNPNYDSGILGKLVGHGKTVVRGGYGRIYGRLNGVNLVLVPLLGVGLIQPVTCQGPSSSGQCLGSGNVNPTNVFRIGTDGNTAPLPSPSPTLSQPFYPGVNGNASAGDVESLDPTYRPETTDNVTLTIQREISHSSTIEVGYIGRKIPAESAAIQPGCSGSEGYWGVERGQGGRHAQLPDHQRAEPHAARQSLAIDYRPDHIRPHYQPSQHSSQHGVRPAHTLLEGIGAEAQPSAPF
jgi:hypothetical protein